MTATPPTAPHGPALKPPPTVLEATRAQWQLHHIACAYGLRAEEISRRRQFIDFLGLGIPFALLCGWVGLGLDQPFLLKVFTAIASAVSTGASVAVIWALVKKWDEQLAAAITVPQVARRLETKLRRARDEALQGKLGAAAKLEKLLEDFADIIDEMHEKKLYIDDVLNLIAQQSTMLEYPDCPCKQCNKTWPKGQPTLTPKQAKAFVKQTGAMKLDVKGRDKKEVGADRCRACSLKRD